MSLSAWRASRQDYDYDVGMSDGRTRGSEVVRNLEGVTAEDGARVPAEQIPAAVTAGDFVYDDGATQTFDANGTTRYVEHGRPTEGTWSVEEDGRFSSFWPPSYQAFYDVRWMAEDKNIVGLRFVDLKSGASFDGRYR